MPTIPDDEVFATAPKLVKRVKSPAVPKTSTAGAGVNLPVHSTGMVIALGGPVTTLPSPIVIAPWVASIFPFKSTFVPSEIAPGCENNDPCI